MKYGIAVFTVLGILMASILSATAQEQPRHHKAKGEKKEGAAVKEGKAGESTLKEITLTGKIAKKTEEGSAKVTYVLVDAAGKEIKLPTPKPTKKDGAEVPAINLADYVDANVKVVGMGIEGEKTVVLKKISTIEKVAAP